MWNIKDIINICEGKLYSENNNVIFEKFSKDTRTLNPGDIYIGIKGENFDGNAFYKEAFNKGAAACILEESFLDKIEISNDNIILVKDAKLALKNLAIAKLNQKKPTVIAVTGSVGKTSTRDMIYSVVSKKYKTLVTEGNYNNDIGLPLTILRLKEEKILLLEMGMNHLHEIEYLTKIAKPDFAVITNVLPVHIENLGSIENILKAKLEIIKGLKANGTLIINNDDEKLNKIDFKKLNVLTCGIENNSTYRANIIDKFEYEVNINGETFCFKNIVGTKPYILNGLIAIALGIELNIDIKDIQEGLNEYKLTEGRLEHLKSNNNVQIINDAYNASTDSMKNAIEYLKNQKGKRKIAILGDINELGEYAEKLHAEVGKYIFSHPIDYLITIGKNSRYISNEVKGSNTYHFETKEEAKNAIKNLLEPDDVVLIKASNGNKFIEIVNYIKENC